jgi:hypothetical protein
VARELIAALCAVLAGAASCGPANRTTDADVVVYGATSSGVIAAVELSRRGRNVILLDPDDHVGGMTSSGLGATDVGDARSVGGLAREFYRRIAAEYGSGSGEVFRFEPHVAERVFRALLEEERVPVVPGARLTSVSRTGNRLAWIDVLGGRTFGARVFIDASYEGDLMARAGVRYRVGRESNAVFGETYNGVRPTEKVAPFRVDPNVTPGVRSSALLPHVVRGPAARHGSGDRRVQAYNYRLCVTNDPTNRISISDPPTDFDASQYELVARYVSGLVTTGRPVDMDSFFWLQPLPNRKFDLNNRQGWLSTDLVGGSDEYPEANVRHRQRIREKHERYMRGLLHFLATDPRIPSAGRASFASFGLCRDEFVRTGGWPPQLYVREARRMVGEYVVTEHDVLRHVEVSDPIAVGSYPIDAHYTARLEQDGDVVYEGGLFVPLAQPYPISYRAITPRVGDAENLLVSVAVSASHVAYATLRMEPVYMVLGQAAAVAADLAIRSGAAVQSVDYARLREELERAQHVVEPP